jgi:hypothetical protein
MTTELKTIRCPMVINDYDMDEFFKQFDFAKEYDNKEYLATDYAFDYGRGEKKYRNYLVLVDVKINDCREKFILRNVEYVVAREL